MTENVNNERLESPTDGEFKGHVPAQGGNNGEKVLLEFASNGNGSGIGEADPEAQTGGVGVEAGQEPTPTPPPTQGRTAENGGENARAAVDGFLKDGSIEKLVNALMGLRIEGDE